MCRNVIHHDLDWNPSVIEQRTGRLDRIGSKAEVSGLPVNVYLPFIEGAQDEKQFWVMRDRERWFNVVMGEGSSLMSASTIGSLNASRFPDARPGGRDGSVSRAMSHSRVGSVWPAAFQLPSVLDRPYAQKERSSRPPPPIRSRPPSRSLIGPGGRTGWDVAELGDFVVQVEVVQVRGGAMAVEVNSRLVVSVADEHLAVQRRGARAKASAA